MSRPPFASIKSSHAEADLPSSWHGNILASTADYLSSLAHFAGAIAIKSAAATADVVRNIIDGK